MTLAGSILLAALLPAATLAQGDTSLATSAHWQLLWEDSGAVRLSNPSAGRQARLTNPRVTFCCDGVEYQPWTADRANVSPDEKYALVQWDDGLPKYTSSEIDLVSLADFRVQKLPLSDLRGSLALPLWSPDSRYAAASGGNTVRLWSVGDEVPGVKLLAVPRVGKLWISGAGGVQFVAAGKQLQVDYTMIQPNAYPYPDWALRAVYGVPGGGLLSTSVVKLPK